MKTLLTVLACSLITSSAFARLIVIAERSSENGGAPPAEVIMIQDEEDNISFQYCLLESGCQLIGEPHSISDYQAAIPKVESDVMAHSTADMTIGGALGLLPMAACLAKVNTCAHFLQKFGAKGSAFGTGAISTLPLFGIVAGPILGKSIREEVVQAEYTEVEEILKDVEGNKRVVVFTDSIRELVGHLSFIEASIASEKQRRQ